MKLVNGDTGRLQRELDSTKSLLARTEILLRETRNNHNTTTSRAVELAEQVALLAAALRLTLTGNVTCEDRRYAAGVLHHIDATTRTLLR